MLFTSDLFGSYALDWELFLILEPHCIECVDVKQCPKKNLTCPIQDIDQFHQSIIPSEKALKYALNKILDIPFKMIAPQHGSILSDEKTVGYIFERLACLKDIGIDGIIEDDHEFDFSNFTVRLENK